MFTGTVNPDDTVCIIVSGDGHIWPFVAVQTQITPGIIAAICIGAKYTRDLNITVSVFQRCFDDGDAFLESVGYIPQFEKSVYIGAGKGQQQRNNNDGSADSCRDAGKIRQTAEITDSNQKQNNGSAPGSLREAGGDNHGIHGAQKTQQINQENAPAIQNFQEIFGG